MVKIYVLTRKFLICSKWFDYSREKCSHSPEAIVGRNCRIGVDIKEEDFTSLILESGESIEKMRRDKSEEN